VITKDGYILELHRIPPRNKQHQPKVVFLQHGLLATSARFLRGGKKPTNSSLGTVTAFRLPFSYIVACSWLKKSF